MMNLPRPVNDNSYNIINNSIEKAALKVQKASEHKAAVREYDLTENKGEDVRNITVSGDGTWMTAGHSSKIGAATVIGCKTGQILGSGTKSKVCKICQAWKNKNKNSPTYRMHKCTMTHVGTSGSMEQAIITGIFHSSVQNYKLKFTGFVGDGDANTYKKVVDSKPYGDTPIEKLECVGHIQKRMGCRLRNLKKRMKGQKLKDGKGLEGKGRLTDKQIDKLQRLYGSAIRRNQHNLQGMRRHVWAIYFHKMATDKHPSGVHTMCSDECPQRKASNEGKTFTNKSCLPEVVMNTIKPIFQDLADPDLLKKCLSGSTQNANESVNNLIWKFAPKKKNHGLVTVNIALSLAVGLFNDGAVTFASVLKQLKLEVGEFTVSWCEAKDSKRIANAQRQARQATHEARVARRQQRLQADEQGAQREGLPYLAGSY